MNSTNSAQSNPSQPSLRSQFAENVAGAFTHAHFQLALDRLRGELDEVQYNLWLKRVEFLETKAYPDSLVIVLGVPDEGTRSWLGIRLVEKLAGAFAREARQSCRVEFQVIGSPSESAQTTNEADHPAEAQTYASVTAAGSPRPFSPYERHVDPSYTFDNFVVGASNQLAHASAFAVAERPAHAYNPLFLYSPPGLGKTHLLNAIGNHVLRKNPNFRIAFLSAESFVNEFIDSIIKKRQNDFKFKYRHSFDLILIDDIQFIAGKDSSQEEFFHTFNALLSSRKQIVLTSDKPPTEIQLLEDRIRTRIEAGLVSDIKPPEIETRIAILRAKAERDDLYLPDEVATFVATHIKSSVRELEGMLIKLQAQSSLTGVEISLELAKQYIRISASEEAAQVTADSILNAVCRKFEIKLSDLRSQKRTKEIALARQIAMYLIRKYLRSTLNEIGLHFGGKDHTTVKHACAKIESALETSDPEITSAIEQVQNLL